MIFNNLFGVLALSAGFIDGALTLSTKLLRSTDSNGIEGPSLVPRQDSTATCLAAKSIATASFLDGQGKGANGVAPGQSPSDTDKVNFIHTCDGKTLTNGLQNKDGSCNPIPMGDIPSFDNMVTTIITSPAQGDDLEANKDFDIKLQVNNLNAGSFTNPQVTYYAAPQSLKNGKIIGHVHVTVQDLKGSLTPNTPPDPTTFVHFKGIDDDGNGKGGLTNTVTGGLPPGFYRICTLSSASNHQPVIMPVAQRGAQDDCIRVTVGQGTGANNAAGNNNGGNAGGNNQGGNAQGGNDQGGNDQGGNNQNGNAQGGNAGGNANSDGKGNGGNTAGKSDGASAGGDNNGGDNKNGAASNGNNNAGNADGKKNGSKSDGKNGGSTSDGKTNGNNNSNSNGSSNGSNDGSDNATKSADDKKPPKPTDGAKSANGNSVIQSDGNKDIAGESKKATKSHKIDNAADGGDNGNDGTNTDKINKAATTSTPGSAQSSTVPSGERKVKRFEGHNSHQEQRRGARPQTRQTRQNMLYMV